jgi:hypothetical protein
MTPTPTEPAPLTRAFTPPSTGMIYGASNTAKTTQLMALAGWLYRTKGLRTRYVVADKGDLGHVQDYIDSGIVDIFPITDQVPVHPAALLRGISKGAWLPLGTKDGKAYLQPAKREKVTVTLPGGMKMEQEISFIPEDIGMYIVESTSSLGDLLKRHFMKTGQKINQDVSFSYSQDSLVDGGKEIFAGSSMSHFGHIQDLVMGFMNDMTSLTVPLIVYSAHESKGEDDITKTPIFGPALLGKAATSKMRKDVGFLLHMDKAPQDVVVPMMGKQTAPAVHPKGPKDKIRAYFEDHPDTVSSSIIWPTNPRFPAASMGKLYERWPNGYIELSLDPDDPKGNIWGFLEMREQCLTEQRKKLEGMRKK